uniref:lipid II:glycine glycyltransferase FemX n=1 Tax=Polynucleobacter sp. TaxID=2029855 RepID=UPI00404748AE
MLVWKKFEGMQSDWDTLLLTSKDYTVFQSYSWGEFKQLKGWVPLRFIAENKSKGVVGMVQILLKTLPLGFGIGWAAGGPVMYFNGKSNQLSSADLHGLVSCLQKDYPKVLFRFHSHLPHNSSDAYLFSQVFSQPYLKINSGFTLGMNIEKGGIEFPAGMTAKHRYYFNKSKNLCLAWSHLSGDLEIEELADIHRNMVSFKKLKESPVSKNDLILLRDKLGSDRVSIIIGYLDSIPVVGCMTYDFGNKSIYMIAGATHNGREISASYAMVGELIQVLGHKGVKEFDFGGIDPCNPDAKGVNHFKRGFGGLIVEQLGEWESASSQMLRFFINSVLWIKSKIA